MAAATSAFIASVGSTLSATPSAARMNENSPIWPRAAATENATRTG